MPGSMVWVVGVRCSSSPPSRSLNHPTSKMAVGLLLFLFLGRSVRSRPRGPRPDQRRKDREGQKPGNGAPACTLHRYHRPYTAANRSAGPVSAVLAWTSEVKTGEQSRRSSARIGRTNLESYENLSVVSQPAQGRKPKGAWSPEMRDLRFPTGTFQFFVITGMGATGPWGPDVTPNPVIGKLVNPSVNAGEPAFTLKSPPAGFTNIGSATTE